MTLNQRLIPEAALRDPDSVEMLRVWIAEQKLHCSIKVGMYHETTSNPEEQAWGVILADVARHVANALAEGYGFNRAEALRKIRESFVKELSAPTSVTDGAFVQKH
jgi:Domain of unknown function (DUF5076)